MTTNVVADSLSGVKVVFREVFCQPQAEMIAIESQTDCSLLRVVISESGHCRGVAM